MRWTPRGVSGDIEDRRAQGGSPIRGSHLGVGGTLLLLLLSIVFRRDFVSMFSGSSGAVPAANQASRSAVQDPAEVKLVQFVSLRKRPRDRFIVRRTRKSTWTWASLTN